MATGLALHVGLNRVDPARYEGWDGTLVACENDAHDMARLARTAGFETTTLLTRDGTVANVTGVLAEAAARLVPGDIMLLTYSGHGGQVPDAPGPDREPDALDETLVFYDRQFLDDEVQAAFRAFADDVRIVALFDCCHSGSGIELPGGAEAEGRFMPEPRQRQLYDRDRAFFTELRRSLAEDAPAGAAGPDALLVSGCQDNQVAADGDVNGAFTEALLKVWDSGAFQGGYRDFHRAIQRELPPTQSPNLYLTGTPDPSFLDQKPFTI
ncbi:MULTISPECIES: caspase family protein [unclassified Streptomyces]|uniref:caspase family protein n=1 Tax=unclassified Streptomyces TaxID=2593676 RepID=UPI0006F7FD43|nr:MULTISPECIES: caspase family protein [unclassified Streptomyces]KQX50791.1 peptidase C14 [Streptomyces sp. Root1304]KRA84956.1 peptidase C14 [Streptomyces sp. Root66D1]